MNTKVLIADDDAGIRTLLSKYLHREGYEIALAEDGLQAIEIAKNTHPDLIILDIVMPRLDGFRAARLIKFYKPLSEIPIIFLTARDAAREIAMAEQTRADVYITKPFDVRQVLKIVNDLMAAQKNA